LSRSCSRRSRLRSSRRQISAAREALAPSLFRRTASTNAAKGLGAGAGAGVGAKAGARAGARARAKVGAGAGARAGVEVGARAPAEAAAIAAANAARTFARPSGSSRDCSRAAVNFDGGVGAGAGAGVWVGAGVRAGAGTKRGAFCSSTCLALRFAALCSSTHSQMRPMLSWYRFGPRRGPLCLVEVCSHSRKPSSRSSRFARSNVLGLIPQDDASVPLKAKNRSLATEILETSSSSTLQSARRPGR